MLVDGDESNIDTVSLKTDLLNHCLSCLLEVGSIMALIPPVLQYNHIILKLLEYIEILAELNCINCFDTVTVAVCKEPSMQRDCNVSSMSLSFEYNTNWKDTSYFDFNDF